MFYLEFSFVNTFTPQTPKIITAQRIYSIKENSSFKIITPASTVTAVIMLEKEDDCTTLITVVE